jgi:protein-S-isoprenylcysteine O-methyltransferase Ste14
MKIPRLYPPVWFLANFGSLFALRHSFPTPFDHPELMTAAGRVLIWGGAAVALGTIISFRLHRTSVIPFRTPEVLLRTGLFRWSRNPIYLGEAIILTGACLKFGHILPWLIIPLFITGANLSFIRWEEATLRQKFGAAYEDYRRQTRRWI